MRRRSGRKVGAGIADDLTTEPDFARRDALEAGDTAQHGGLAAARRAERGNRSGHFRGRRRGADDPMRAEGEIDVDELKMWHREGLSGDCANYCTAAFQMRSIIIPGSTGGRTIRSPARRTRNPNGTQGRAGRNGPALVVTDRHRSPHRSPHRRAGAVGVFERFRGRHQRDLGAPQRDGAGRVRLQYRGLVHRRRVGRGVDRHHHGVADDDAGFSRPTFLRVGAGAPDGHAGLCDGLRVHRFPAVRRPGADGLARVLRLARGRLLVP